MIRLKQLIAEWTGAQWQACRQWKSHRNQFISGTDRAKITFIKNLGPMFVLKYTGPATGISISHAYGGSGDTLHQMFNVLICEINPWLLEKNYKPKIGEITTRCEKLSDNKYVLIITVPCSYIHGPLMGDKWQLNHRGGWGHDPGMSAVVNASPKKAITSGLMETVTEYTDVPGHREIITHFASYPTELNKTSLE